MAYKDPAAAVEYNRRYRAANPDKQSKWQAEYRGRNPDKVKANQAKYRAKPENKAKRAEYYQANKDRCKQSSTRSRLRTLYGLTLEQHQQMHDAQNGLCLICSRPHSESPLHIDHCHATGRVRGLLCGSCNKALGLLRDDPELALKASEYLKCR